MTFARSKNKVKSTAALRGGTFNRGKVMKVTRLKRGYRINLSDAEMSVLTKVFSEGSGSSMIEDPDEWPWTPAEKGVARKIPFMLGEQWLDVTEDKRGK
tara:strand:- start:287 stop:583 length:297 start_codon:yes stop_codon:yes gene_type:complete